MSSRAGKGSGAALPREHAEPRFRRGLAVAGGDRRLPREPDTSGAEQRVPRELAVAGAEPRPPRAPAAAGADQRLPRDEALAAAPRALRETLELFWLKTGRADLAAEELHALRALDHLHTPAVIQQTITRAVERFRRRGADPATLSLTYVHDSLRRFSTLRHDAPSARVPAVPMAAAYPPGLTRLS